MPPSYTPSINIIEDVIKDVKYIPTSNSWAVYSQIMNNFQTGIRSFNIIGSYGTGKSAFLLALAKHFQGDEQYFDILNGQFNGCKKFEFIRIVGESTSFIEHLAELLDQTAEPKKIISYLKSKQEKLKKQNTGLVILVDEFGKFLEHAVKNDADKELYFIQQLAEFTNVPTRNVLFITTLHQNFDAYAQGLVESQRKEWEKVKGRLKEITFNEPVEQLLNLASQFLLEEYPELNRSRRNKTLLDQIKKNKAFNLLSDLSSQFAADIVPFDPLSAMILTLGLQKYGQNERSLFSFLQTDENLALKRFIESNQKDDYYNLNHVYDYFYYNYYSVLTSKYNPDVFKWGMIRRSLDRVEVEIDKYVSECQQLVKVIGLMDVLGNPASKLNASLVETYAKTCLGIKNAGEVLELLEDKRIIRYRAYRSRYNLFDGTDVDIEETLKQAKEEIGSVNVGLELESYLRNPHVLAKSVSYKKGTPRYFEYKITNSPIDNVSGVTGEIDGVINLVVSDESISKLKDKMLGKEPVLYGVFKDYSVIKSTIVDIKSVAIAINKIGNEDEIAKKEFILFRDNQVELLNDLMELNLFGKDGWVSWYCFDKGKEKCIKINIENARELNKQLSKIVEEIYTGTPDFKNELMNRTNVSGSIHYAKKKYIDQLISSWNLPNLGFDKKLMPPEKTIYWTLLKQTGLHKNVSNVVADFSSDSIIESFQPLWNASMEYLESTTTGKRTLTEFIRILSRKPFKLKDGLIEFWLISFLFIQREEYALSKEGKYIPKFTKEEAELFIRKSDNYTIKKFNIKGVKLDLFKKYREITQTYSTEKVTNKGFQEIARPFMVFYRQLPAYSQETKKISSDAANFRSIISKAKELEKTFFEDLPASFGISLNKLNSDNEVLTDFARRIQDSISELKVAYVELLERIEAKLKELFALEETVTFEECRTHIQKRYAKIRSHLLSAKLKTFYNRLNSPIPDRDAWLNSIVQAVMSKQLRAINDKEEIITIDKLYHVFQELDNLLELSKSDFDEGKEMAYRIEISSFEKTPMKKNIILNKRQSKEMPNLLDKLRNELDQVKDEKLSQAALLQLLKDYLEDDKG